MDCLRSAFGGAEERDRPLSMYPFSRTVLLPNCYLVMTLQRVEMFQGTLYNDPSKLKVFEQVFGNHPMNAFNNIHHLGNFKVNCCTS